MKGKKLIIKMVSIAIVLLMCFSVSIPKIKADNCVLISLSSQKYQGGTFVPVESVSAGNDVYVAVECGNVSSLGGITLSVSYDSNLFTFKPNASFCSISDSNSQVQFNSVNGKVLTAWETASSTTTFSSGAMFYLVFTAKSDISAATQGQFSLNVSEMFDGSNAQKDIPYQVGGAINVGISVVTVPQATLDLIGKLKDITYPNSLTDITAAEEAFNALSAKQQTSLKNTYPQYFTYLDTARSRYYALAEEASRESIKKEADLFLKDHAAVLKLTTDTVKLSDEAAVKAAYDALGTMSSKAKAMLDSATKTLVANLKAEIDNLKKEASHKQEVEDEVKEFKETYKEVLNTEVVAFFSEMPIEYNTIVSEGLLIYGLLSEDAQKQLKKEYDLLDSHSKMLTGLIAQNEHDQKIMDQVTEFQKTWIQVFKINSVNVSLADRTAIEMVLYAFSQITDEEVKAALQPRISNLENLLTVIDKMEDLSDEDELDEDEETDNGGSQSVVEKLIQKVKQIQYTESGYGVIIWLLLILLAVSILLGIGSFFIYYILGKFKREDIEETE